MTPWRLARRAVVALAVLAALVFAATGVRVWQVGRQDHRDPADAIVVLGASQHDGRPSEIFQARLDHAAGLYGQRVAPRVLTVGGKRAGDRYTEAEAGARYLRRAGVPPTSVYDVPSGADTLTSLRAVAALLIERRWTRVVLVTDPWHSLRSKAMAEDAGLDATTSPARGGADRGRLRDLRYIARESAAYLYYEVVHRGLRRGPPAGAGRPGEKSRAPRRTAAGPA